MTPEGDDGGRWWPSPPGMLKVNASPRGEGAPACLRGAWAKWERAVEHHRQLVDVGRAWLNAPAFRIDVQYDASVDAHVASFVVLHAPPARLGAIAGDCLHNLRSALDLLAWELANEHWMTEPESRPKKFHDVRFPIASWDKTEASFEKQSALRHFDAQAREKILEFQQFQMADRGYEPLVVLGMLSNIDKHRLILVGATSTQLQDNHFSWEPKHLQATEELLLEVGDAFDDGTRFAVIRFEDEGHPEAIVTAAPPASELRLTYDGKSSFGPLMFAACVWRVREILAAFEPILATS